MTEAVAPGQERAWLGWKAPDPLDFRDQKFAFGRALAGEVLPIANLPSKAAPQRKEVDKHGVLDQGPTGSCTGHGVGLIAAVELNVDLIQGDCREAMKALPNESVHMVLTDPPYFLDGLDTGWKKGGKDAVKATGTVGGLPIGMKFDPRHGVALQAFIEDVAGQWDRLLVPGGFALVFSQPRLAHRIAMGMEEAGFEIRDQICWRFTQRAQFKAFSQDHFVERMDIPQARKRELIRSMDGRRTPQLRPQFEAVILAQKPKIGTFVENWEKHEVGLMDARSTLDTKVPSNVMTWEKPSSAERGAADGHLTPKPVKLLEHLIELFTKPGQVVLDSFLGSGSTAVAAVKTRRNCIGIEISPEYIGIARQRLGEK